MSDELDELEGISSLFITQKARRPTPKMVKQSRAWVGKCAEHSKRSVSARVARSRMARSVKITLATRA